MLLSVRQGSDAGFLFVPPASLSNSPSSVGSYPGATLAGTQAEFTVEDFCFMYGPHKSYEERFWSKVDKSGDCWLWLAGGMNGYGVFSTYEDGKSLTHYAHRYAFELVRGPIEEGLTLDHLCHTLDPACGGGNSCKHRRCVNPDHLDPTTDIDNVMRGKSAAALNFAKTHCHRGHPFSPENTYISKEGGRSCRTCAREWYHTNKPFGPARIHHNTLKTHCSNGHEFTPENTRVSGGSRYCRTCRKAYMKAFHLARAKK